MLLCGRSAAQRASFKLTRFSIVKKAYSGASLECYNCRKAAHTASFCPSARTEVSPEDRVHWVESLLALPTEDIATLYQGMPVEEVMTKLEARGRVLNAGYMGKLC